jgi:hypothetical protein
VFFAAYGKTQDLFRTKVYTIILLSNWQHYYTVDIIYHTFIEKYSKIANFLLCQQTLRQQWLFSALGASP